MSGKARLLCLWLFLAAVAVPGGIFAAGFDHRHGGYERLLKAHVTEGRVDYTGLNQDLKNLDAYLDGLAAVLKEDFQSWTQAQRLAFLINLYNAQTLRLILDHYGRIKR